MSAPAYFDGVPSTGTFWWLAKLAGGGGGERVRDGERQVFAARRGCGLETFVLSALLGLAALGIGFELLQRGVGVWAWALALPVAFLGLHVIGLVCAVAGELLIKARLLRRGWQQGFNGVAFAACVALAGIAVGAWLALPWIAWVVCEMFAWPARRFWEMSGEGAG